MRKLCEIFQEPINGEWGNEDTTGSGIPVLRTTNFTNEGVINYSNVVTRLINKKNINEKFLVSGDIIIEKSGGSSNQPVGRVVFFDGEENKYLCNNFTSILRLKDKKSNSPKYVFYYLFAKHRNGETIKYQNKTTGILNLKLDKYIAEMRINLPLIKTQEQIVKTLDLTLELLTLRKQQLAELDNFIKAVFYNMFGDPMKNDKGWDKMKLSNCCYVNPRKSEIHYFNDDLDVSFISMASVSVDGSIDTSEVKKYKEVKKGFTYFYENDVLFAKITPCMENGKGAIARGLKNSIGFGSTEFHVLRPKKGISNSEWLYYLTTLPIFREIAEKSMTGSAGQKRVPASFFDKYIVPLPPLSLQDKFADIVAKTEEQKSIVKKAIADTQLLFDSLMSQYFDQ